jgi:hypothetical protein
MVDTHNTITIPKALVKLRKIIDLDDEDAELVRQVLVELARASFHRGKNHGKETQANKTQPDGTDSISTKTEDSKIKDVV